MYLIIGWRDGHNFSQGFFVLPLESAAFRASKKLKSGVGNLAIARVGNHQSRKAVEVRRVDSVWVVVMAVRRIRLNIALDVPEIIDEINIGVKSKQELN